MTFSSKFFIGVGKKTRFRLPFWAPTLGRFIPQPKWLKRWYYNKSFQWWGHPSNHHWKGGELQIYTDLLPGERDIWSGTYCQGKDESNIPLSSLSDLVK